MNKKKKIKRPHHKGINLKKANAGMKSVKTNDVKKLIKMLDKYKFKKN